MTSPVNICNLALSHIGDAGMISSIDPPDGSTQAARCAMFYPVARNELLEAHDWAFSLKRVTLAELADPTGVWLYRYAHPSDAIRIVKVLPGDLSQAEPTARFDIEAADSGDLTILTDAPEATAVYLDLITDVGKFPQLALSALSWNLASYLAGPLLKGKAGATFGEYCAKRYALTLAEAMKADVRQHKPKQEFTPSTIKARQ